MSSPLETLRANASNLDSITLSDDGKSLTFAGSSESVDATVKYTVPETPDGAAYSLASLYILCLEPQSILARKRACDKYGIDDNVKVTHRTPFLTYFGLLAGDTTAADTASASPEKTTAEGDAAGGSQQDDDDDMDVDDDDVEMMDVEMETSSSQQPKADTDADKATETTSTTAATESEKDEAAAKKSSSKSSASDPAASSSSHSKRSSSRDEEDRRKKHHSHSSRKDKDHHHHSSSRKDRERDRHHRDRDSKSSKDKGEKDKKDSKKDKTPITNEQVMQNLSFLHGKREGDLKRKDADFPSMDATTTTTTTTVKDDGDTTDQANPSQENDTPSDSIDATTTITAIETTTTTTTTSLAAPTSSPDIVTETEDEKKSRENTAINEALSSEGFDFSPDIIAADRDATEKITAMETPVGDSASVLRFASRDFSRVLGLYMEVKRNEERAAAQQNSNSGSSKHSKRHKKDASSGGSGWEKSKSSSSKHDMSKSSSSTIPNNPTLKKPVGLPLIIVPNAMTSPIGMNNAKDFFAQAKFIPRDRSKKVPTLTFQRRMSSRLLRLGGGGGGGSGHNHSSSGMMEYEVMDNPANKLKRQDWDRVVAVIALGEKWQFKNWKWAEPVEIFSNCFGFYIGMEGAPEPKGLQGWNVKKAFLNRDKRGLDTVAHATFWNQLDEWMVLHKRQYIPNVGH